MTNEQNNNETIENQEEFKVVEVEAHEEATSAPEEAPQEQSADDNYDGFIFTHYHGKTSRNLSSYDPNKDNTTKSSKVTHSHKRRHRHRFKHQPWWKKILIILGWILLALAALGIIGIIAFFIMRSVGYSQLLDNNANASITPPVISNVDMQVDNDARTITYQGTTYKYNDKMTSILCMGIDKKGGVGLGLENGEVGTAGQADALYMVAMDTSTGKTSVIGISRDIFADVDYNLDDGTYGGIKKMPVCLAYSYGDGRDESAKNTEKAVSRLFYNLPINSYFAMELQGIVELNDAVGGVTVVMTDNTFGEHYGYYNGESWHLLGDSTLTYLQSRDQVSLEASTNRMDRQLNYIQAFGTRTIEMTKQNLSIPLDLFNIVQSNSATDLTPSKITALASTIITSDKEIVFTKIPGSVTQNGEYAEYVIDEQGMMELVLDIYYTPVN